MTEVRCVLVGDGGVGKTSILVSYAKNQFPPDYAPTVFAAFAVTVMINGEPFLLRLVDTAGQDDYDEMRPLSYPLTDVFIICFSVVSQSSYENVRQKWIKEIRQQMPSAPFLLVGTQTDLRNHRLVLDNLKKEGRRPMSYSAGERLAKELKAAKYVECSALTQEGLKTVFDEAVIAALKPRKRYKKRRCVII